LAKRNTDHGSGLGVYRWVVERTISWLRQYRRLRIRYKRYPALHQAFLTLGCILICHKCLIVLILLGALSIFGSWITSTASPPFGKA